MPKLDEPEKFERNPIPAGEHILTLKAIKPTEGPNTFEAPSLNEETGLMEQPIRREWIWQFESEVIDPKTKKPYEYAIWTSRFFSPTSDKNKLTLLMRMLAPTSSDDQRRTMIETDSLIGHRWEAMIIMSTNRNGKSYPTHTYFKPLVASAVATQTFKGGPHGTVKRLVPMDPAAVEAIKLTYKAVQTYRNEHPEDTKSSKFFTDWVNFMMAKAGGKWENLFADDDLAKEAYALLGLGDPPGAVADSVPLPFDPDNVPF